MMRIALLGANGQIGWELQRALGPLGEVDALGREVDLADLGRLEAELLNLGPDLIVNAAGYTQVDEAERDPTMAFLINAHAPGVMADVAARLGAVLVHYSTDYVFDGGAGRPVSEVDPPSPINVYGRSKLAGEEAIRAAVCRHLILRTSWVHASRRSNFLRSILAAAARAERLTVVDDQIGAPTGADLVADVTAHVVRSAMARAEGLGAYHLAASGAVSRWELARFLVREATLRGARLRLSEDDILPAKLAEQTSGAPRPRDCRLDTVRLRQVFGLNLPPWQAGVLRVLDTWAEHKAWPGEVQ